MTLSWGAWRNLTFNSCGSCTFAFLKNSLSHLLFAGENYYGSKQKVTGLMSFSPSLCDTTVTRLAKPRGLLAVRRGGTCNERLHPKHSFLLFYFGLCCLGWSVLRKEARFHGIRTFALSSSYSHSSFTQRTPVQLPTLMRGKLFPPQDDVNGSGQIRATALARRLFSHATLPVTFPRDSALSVELWVR